MKSTVLGISLTASMVGIGILAATPAAAQWQSLSWAEAPADNPLKGFMPYQGDGGSTLPHSLEFNYLGMDVLMPADGVVDLGPLEALLVDVASRGRQTVFRVYLDYPDFDNAVPTWLLSGPGAVTQFPYTVYGGGSSPDYDNQRLLTAIETLTAAMGAAYDGDSRLGFVEVGFVGFWGEWHTYPYDGDTQSPNLMPSIASQRRVLQAFSNAFTATPIVVSQDLLDQFDATTPCGATSLCPADFASLDIGFHDDNFCVGTYDAGANEDWFFWSKLVDRGLDQLWLTVSIGGEVQPDIQQDLFAAGWTGQSFDAAVSAVHASWLLDQFAFEVDNDPVRAANTLAAARLLGYQLHVVAAALPSATTMDSLQIGVRIENLGAAPFPASWPVEVGLFDSTGAQVGGWTAPWDLSSILPGAGPVELWLSVPGHGLGAGTYDVGLRVTNVMPGGRPLRFANATQGPEWLSLGPLEILGPEIVVFVDGFEGGDFDEWSSVVGS